MRVGHKPIIVAVTLKQVVSQFHPVEVPVWRGVVLIFYGNQGVRFWWSAGDTRQVDVIVAQGLFWCDIVIV